MRDNSPPLTFGNKDEALDGYADYGQYDELRLERGAASAAWAKAEYLTVADGRSFPPVRGGARIPDLRSSCGENGG